MNLFGVKVLLTSVLFSIFKLSLAAQIPIAALRESGVTTAVCTFEFDTSLTADHHGRGTWYEPGLGNCGWTNNRNEKVLAIGKRLYDRNGGKNCGQMVEIVNNKNGKKAWGKTVDSCPGCGDDDLDLSPALFQQLDSLSVGVIQITWHFLPKFQELEWEGSS